MRVIGGKHRNRRIEAIDDKKLRPTAARTREAIFNILSHAEFAEDGVTVIDDAVVLDLFCGTGALGIEALSRGAKHVIFVDIEQKHLDVTRANVKFLDESENATFIRSDSANPPPARTQCNVVFLDPPYKKGLLGKALHNLIAGNWLADNAIVVVEMGKFEKLPEHEGYEVLRERVYGGTAVVILRYTKVTAAV